MKPSAEAYCDVDSFLLEQGTLVDVRSPAEYAKGHITGAVSIPLFSDNERATVGTLYKKEGRQDAVDAGLEIVGPKMSAFVQQARKLEDDRLRVYCWRGGMRSASMAWLFETAGIPTMVLNGGYKAYRRKLLADLEDLPGLIVLQGFTGAGKTDILLEMQRRGEQVVDLEGLAHHRGSAFGALGMEAQPESQQFQNDCHAEIGKLDKSRRIWVEGESKNIGKCCMAETLWSSMNAARLMEVQVPLEDRVQRLVNSYGQYPAEELKESIVKLTRKLGGQHVKRLFELLDQGDLASVAETLLHYYDESYMFSRSRHKLSKPEEVLCEDGDATRNAEVLIARAEALNW